MSLLFFINPIKKMILSHCDYLHHYSHVCLCTFDGYVASNMFRASSSERFPAR